MKCPRCNNTTFKAVYFELPSGETINVVAGRECTKCRRYIELPHSRIAMGVLEYMSRNNPEDEIARVTYKALNDLIYKEHTVPTTFDVKAWNELLSLIVYGAITGKKVRAKYVKWVISGYWVNSPLCMIILVYLYFVGSATRSSIDRHVRQLGYSGFTFYAEPLQRLLLFGAVSRKKVGRYTIYKLTEVGKGIVHLVAYNYSRTMRHPLIEDIKYIPIAKSKETDLIFRAW